MGEMPIAEQLSFKARLADNDDLSKSFEEFKALFETVEEAALCEKLEDFHSSVIEQKEETPTKTLNISKFRFNYRIAASVTILLAIGGFWFFNSQNSNEKLFNEYYSPDPGLPTVMGANDNYAFYEAMVDYKQGNYDIAIAKWEKLLVSKPENDTLNYFLGSAYLAIEEPTRAVSFLEKAIQAKSSSFRNEAHYYVGLIYLKSGKQQKAVEALNSSELQKAAELHQKLTASQK
ncbi:tetratricopeptide repeat protein [Maribacter halichondriae]|uniref:tetratricopeptide repeat protein n=1 Tax=Maribacter halichondriae TaxID=2980554 RepID=UPI00235A2038|nr:tetratricopeptide repeat protein [Maribacter sp. Hal144]